MKNKLIIVWLIAIGLMFCLLFEYTYIIHNMHVYTDAGYNDIVYIELFGQVHGYYASPL